MSREMSKARNYLAENYGCCNIQFDLIKENEIPAIIKVNFDILGPSTKVKKVFSLNVDVHNIETKKFIPFIHHEKAWESRPEVKIEQQPQLSQ